MYMIDEHTDVYTYQYVYYIYIYVYNEFIKTQIWNAVYLQSNVTDCKTYMCSLLFYNLALVEPPATPPGLQICKQQVPNITWNV